MREERSFSIPQVVVITAFVDSLVGVVGWIQNLEIRKADRAEVSTKADAANVEKALDSIQQDLKYIRVRVDQHMDFSRRPIDGR